MGILVGSEECMYMHSEQDDDKCMPIMVMKDSKAKVIVTDVVISEQRCGGVHRRSMKEGMKTTRVQKLEESSRAGDHGIEGGG